jgi:hypothetical protein
VAILGAQPEPGIETALLMASDYPARLFGLTAWADLKVGREGPVAVFHWDGAELALNTRVGF